MTYDPAGFVRALVSGTVIRAGQALEAAGNALLTVASPPGSQGATQNPPGGAGGVGTSPGSIGSGPVAPGQLWYTAPLSGSCAPGYHLEQVNLGGYGVPTIIYVCVLDGHHYPGPTGGGSTSGVV